MCSSENIINLIDQALAMVENLSTEESDLIFHNMASAYEYREELVENFALPLGKCESPEENKKRRLIACCVLLGFFMGSVSGVKNLLTQAIDAIDNIDSQAIAGLPSAPPSKDYD